MQKNCTKFSNEAYFRVKVKKIIVFLAIVISSSGGWTLPLLSPDALLEVGGPGFSAKTSYAGSCLQTDKYYFLLYFFRRKNSVDLIFTLNTGKIYDLKKPTERNASFRGKCANVLPNMLSNE